MCHNKNELKSAIAKYRRLSAQKSEIEKELKAAKEEIFEYLEYNEIEPKEKVVGQNFVLSFSICTTTSFDKELLKLVIGDDFTPYQKQVQYKRLNIK